MEPIRQPILATWQARVRSIVDLCATLAMLAAAGAILWLVFGTRYTQQRPALPREFISLDGTPRIGNLDASVVLVEFSDFECPYCRKFEQDVWPTLKTRFVDTGQLQVSFRHFPLEHHPQAQIAAEAAVCAERYGRFWPMVDVLFSGKYPLDRRLLSNYATLVGIAGRDFDGCMEDDAAEGQIQRDTSLARVLNVTGTPTFVIGRLNRDHSMRPLGVLYGVVPVDRLENAILKIGSS
jgi:protein-disulfide isomerase